MIATARPAKETTTMDTTTTTHELKPLRPDAWLTQPDDWGCSCGSAMWVDLTAAVCVDSGHHLGRFNAPRNVTYTIDYSDTGNADHAFGLEFRFVKSGGRSGGSVGQLLTRWFATEEDRQLFVAGDSLIDVRRLTCAAVLQAT